MPDAFASGTRDLLFVANYKAAEGQGVSVYDWRGGGEETHGKASWQWLQYIDAPGAGEATHCSVGGSLDDGSREELIVLPSWYANGSFATTTWVLAYVPLDPSTPGPSKPGALFQRRQALPTFGSHDAECFTSMSAAGVATTVLLLANGRLDSGRRDVESVVYTYDVAAGRFVVLQQLPTVGVHDFELVMVAGRTLAVAANGASWSASDNPSDDGEFCDNAVDVYSWDGQRFRPFQSLSVGGCTTFVRSWRSPVPPRTNHSNGEERVLLAIAVERTRVGSFDGGVLVYEWAEEHSWFPPKFPSG